MEPCSFGQRCGSRLPRGRGIATLRENRRIVLDSGQRPAGRHPCTLHPNRGPRLPCEAVIPFTSARMMRAIPVSAKEVSMEAKDVMTSPVISVGADTSIEETAGLMLERRISAVPVVDASGRLQGIVSEGDLMRHSKAGTGHSRSWWLSLFADRGQLAAGLHENARPDGGRCHDAHGRHGDREHTARQDRHASRTPSHQAGADRAPRESRRHRQSCKPAARSCRAEGHGTQDSGKGPRHPRPHPERARRSRRGQGLRQRRRHQRSGRAVGLVESETQKRALAIAAKSTRA